MRTCQFLDYFKWENFAKVIQRAMIACQSSEHSIEGEFSGVRKIVKTGAATKTVLDMSCLDMPVI
jgi:DNA-damage-inducible protein D